MSIFAEKQRIVKRLILLLLFVLIIAITIWWRAPIIGDGWNKQTMYVGLLDTWYGNSTDSKAYAMWIDDDSSRGIFKIKEIADSLRIPVFFAVIADKMEPIVADSLASWQRRGTGILLHGLRHERWQEWNEIQIKLDIHQSKQRLYEQGFDTTQILKIVIPPHGCNTKSIRKVIEQQDYKMITGASLVNPDRHVFQYGRIIIGPDTNLDTMQDILKKAYDRKAFIIFGTHSSIPKSFSADKTKEVLRITKDMGFCFNIYE